jgi:hypothetical protein
MKERLLLDRIYVHRNDLAVNKAVERAFSVLTDSAYASLAFLYEAVMAAEMAFYLAVFPLFIAHGLFHTFIIATEEDM